MEMLQMPIIRSKMSATLAQIWREATEYRHEPVDSLVTRILVVLVNGDERPVTYRALEETLLDALRDRDKARAVVERVTKRIRTAVSDEPRPVDPDEVDEAFQKICTNHAGKRGPKASRPQQIRELFRGREREGITLEELMEAFSDVTDPYQSAQRTISRLNEIFDSLGLDLQIERVSVYRFRHQSPK